MGVTHKKFLMPLTTMLDMFLLQTGRILEAMNKASSWSTSSGHLRAQIIYFMAENLHARREEFSSASIKCLVIKVEKRS